MQSPSTILEISMGEFDESDIVRLEDAYNESNAGDRNKSLTFDSINL